MNSLSVKTSRILICDDHPVCTVGLEFVARSYFPANTEIQSFFSAGEVRKSLSLYTYDLAILDLQLPDISGVQLIQEVRERDPHLPVVVVTASRDINLLGSLQKVGVKAILSKAHTKNIFVSALKHALNPMSRGLFIDDNLKDFFEQESRYELTAREWEVLAYIAKGLTNEAIANELKCSIETVKTHRAKLGQKTSSRNRAELTAWYLQRKN